ncbi:MAG: M48 family metalloprotease [Nitrospinota bacterium]|nr:M48 family metalloprotease [Nitrospinota bacterium]
MNYRILSAGLIAALAAGCASLPIDQDVMNMANKVFDQNVMNIANKVWKKRDVIQKTGSALRKGFSDLSDEEEYYIGRAVAAKILSQYSPVEEKSRTTYINTLGQTLSRHSSRPQTFAGYHFLLISSPEINSFAAPGGFVFITTGLYSKLKTEEELAAVLAHEISHVTLRHGLTAIKTANLTQAFSIIGTEAMKEYGAKELAQLTAAFEDSINDIVNQLVVNGYSRSQEYEADAEAMRVAWKSGYDPAGLTRFLSTLGSISGKGGAGLFKTHPPADDRLKYASKAMKKEGISGSTLKNRTHRFQRYAMK